MHRLWLSAFHVPIIIESEVRAVKGRDRGGGVMAAHRKQDRHFHNLGELHELTFSCHKRCVASAAVPVGRPGHRESTFPVRCLRTDAGAFVSSCTPDCDENGVRQKHFDLFNEQDVRSGSSLIPGLGPFVSQLFVSKKSIERR